MDSTWQNTASARRFGAAADRAGAKPGDPSVHALSATQAEFDGLAKLALHVCRAADWVALSVGWQDPQGFVQLSAEAGSEGGLAVDMVAVQSQVRAEGGTIQVCDPSAGGAVEGGVIGLPLRLPGGSVAGVLVAASKAAESLEQEDLAPLELLAQQAESHVASAFHAGKVDRLRAQLAAGAERFDALEAASCEGSWTFDLILASVQVSERLFDLLGLPKTHGSLPMMVLLQCVHADDRRPLVAFTAQILRDHGARAMVCRCRHASGEWRFFEVRAVAIGHRAEGGLAPRVVGTLKDIHVQHATDRKLQRVNRLLAESQALARCGAWELDPASGEVFWTDETYRIHETSMSGVDGLAALTLEDVLDFYVPESRRRFREAIQLAVECGRGFSLDLEIITAACRRVWVRVSGGAVFVDGAIVRVSGALQDISRQRRIDGELVASRERAEAASAAKSAFLATMSHEIRTPMHAVLGYAEMLRESVEDPAQLEHVDIITSSGQALLRLIDDILDFSKCEAGKLSLNVDAFDACRVAVETVQMLVPTASGKGLDLVVEDGAKHAIVAADPQRVRQVLTNLLGNAIKFSSRGRVAVRISVVGGEGDRSNGEGFVRCEVSDEGIGIEPQEIDRLFEDFVQVDSSARRKFEGAGLGLAISRRLIESMGGQIGATSTFGAGSTFWFTLPAGQAAVASKEPVERPAVAARGDSEKPIPAQGNARRVLLVEDNPINLRLATAILERVGFEIDTATDGEIAVEKYRAHSYDVILMDCLMPDVDGFEATRRIREHERTSGAKVPIIALTANAMPEDRRACLAAGMDDFVSKPFSRDEILGAIARRIPVAD
ncbi:MAG: response regulator [Planctomycetota bacterium]